MSYNFFPDNFEYDECTAKGSCSISPSISALQEVLLICLRELAFYVLKLKSSGADCSAQEQVIISVLSNQISTTDYSDEQLLNFVSNIYSYVLKSKKEYQKTCKKLSVEYKELKNGLNLTPQMKLSEIISIGEKAFLYKYKRISPRQKNMYDILLSVIKSTATTLFKLADYNIYNPDSVLAILRGLDILNHPRYSLDKCKKHIRSLAHFDMLLTKKLSEEQIRMFGQIDSTEVSFSTTKGKAILVSGESLRDLDKILKAAAKKDIDVYTHDELLAAHAFEKFRNYTNLKGHYGTCNENCVLDFATFPGAILLTKNSNINIEYLYRGRLFTTSEILPQGVIAVKNDDFSAVIESAENAKGFAKGQTRSSETVGFNPQEIESAFEKLKNNLKTGKIRKVIVLGLSANKRIQTEYFHKFLLKLPEDVFVLSFSISFEHKHLLYINLANNRQLVYEVLKKLFNVIPMNSEDIIFFLAKCDITSISNMINMREMGVKNIYLTNCSPNVINPAIQNFLETVYNIKNTTTPEKDLENFGL